MLRRTRNLVMIALMMALAVTLVPAGPTVKADESITFLAVEDAYTENGSNVNTNLIKVSSEHQRVAYLKLNISGLDGFVASAKLQLRAVQQGGNPGMEVYLAESNDWSESAIDGRTAPPQGTLIGTYDEDVRPGSKIQVELDTSIIKEDGIYTLILKSTKEDLSFTSNIGDDAAKHQPRMIVETSQRPVCDLLIPNSTQVLFVGDETGLNAQPGDVVCIEAGERPAPLNLKEFHGTEERPITFINYGGQAVIEGGETDWWAVTIGRSSHFRFTGTGDPSFKYGFKLSIRNNGGSIFEASQKATNYEVDHLSIIEDKIGYAGMSLKTDPSCDGSTNRGGFTQYNTIVHDNYIEGTRGEGIYMGHSNYEQGMGRTCDGERVSLYPHQLEGVRVYDNIFKDIGRDAIQIGSAVADVEVYDNLIDNYGTNNDLYHTNGIQINPGTTGKYYNNYILSEGIGGKVGIHNLGRGDIQIYNNVIVDPAQYGMYSADRYNPDDPVYDESPVHIWNNTIINPAQQGIKFVNKIVKSNTIRNNVIVHPNEDGATNFYVQLDPASDMTLSNNYFTRNILDADFVDEASGNYRLQSVSPLIDAGYDLTSEGVTFDFDNQERPSGGAFDIGAFEYTAP